MNVYGSIAEVCDESRDTQGVMFAVLRRCVAGETKNGAPYFDLEFGDTTGSVGGKIWDDRGTREAMAAADELEPGVTVKVGFVVNEYQGAVQLTVKKLRAAEPGEDGLDPSVLFGDVPDWVPAARCKTLVFDLETVPAANVRELPPTIVKSLTEHAERRDMDQSAIMGLSPWFGKIVSCAFGEGESAAGEENVTVLAVPKDDQADEDWPEWIRPVSEAELLRAFWALASLAEVVVSFNGRGFDVPFLVGRSLVHGIDARVDLLSKPFSLKPHLDLLDLVSQRGRGPANLDVVCWALGITSPKGEMDGSMVAPAYESGKLAEICEYNRHDVRATTAVYRALRDRVLRYRRDWS